ncbi:alpha/beta hydrolase family protein [Galbibacter mesophilus]|uniref:alpha/beta hydrolase family protein n=1 Tax=Galbibacter mesophilus TaxID=379069 RepID=UPI00191E924E|nr:prolyl oligopeptidase family serine peptidase [Galbibacter mesophilus]MCM5662034.1 prolyl oligopeptidase family serine peptidase [Galbibacter mesophilus]
MKKILFLIVLCFNFSLAQEKLTYQKPSEELLKLVDVELAPRVNMNSEGNKIILLYRSRYSTIEELSEEELRLAGLRINPKKNIGSRTSYYYDIKIKNTTSKNAEEITGLPENLRAANIEWSPDESKIAFTNTNSEGVSLWIIDVDKKSARKIETPFINANLGSSINWFKDGKSLLIKTTPEDRKELIDTKNSIPTGPTISTNDGKEAQNRTYQDLLSNPNDEFNFEQLALSKLHKVSLDGQISVWKDTDMYRGISFSPDGEYVMVSKLSKPFSYLVPYYRFPTITLIYTKDGTMVNEVNKAPLTEELPKGFMAVRTGKRNFEWRRDKPATLIYTVALDEGDPEKETEFRDEIFALEAPFNDEGQSILKTKNRFSQILWGNNTTAVAYDYWWNNRNTKTYVFNPSNNKKQPVIIEDRNYQDKYSDPGNFVTHKNEFHQNVLFLDKEKNTYLMGEGYSEEGQHPFIDKFNLNSLKKERLYTSSLKNKKEDLLEFKPEENRVLTRIESPTTYPNYYFRKLNSKKEPQQLTFFENPFESVAGIHKEVITYKRDDGLELSGTLYLPVGYNMNKKEKNPLILWAYPREYKDKNSASQNTQNPNDFTYLYYGSPIYWVAKGYVVLDDAAFPIIGEKDEEPNDTFREQLVANAKAAIDAVDKLGYIDRTKVAVGGHSYGAFMVANLLSHSDLFAAGIARSGAYNRTLTPFGFQSEERNYWEAPEIYNTMSPFMHAEKMKHPLLLIHGEADNNSGTYPMQSERYFNALKGLGATVRLVMLPRESHGYRAKESVLHVIWEQDQWLEKYLKKDNKISK